MIRKGARTTLRDPPQSHLYVPQIISSLFLICYFSFVMKQAKSQISHLSGRVHNVTITSRLLQYMPVL